MMRKLAYLTALVLIVAGLGMQASASETYFKFKIDSPSELALLTKIISIDNIRDATVYAYANDEQMARFQELGYEYVVLPHPGTLLEDPKMATDRDAVRQWNSYPTFGTYVAMMNQFAADYPALCRIVNIGYSVEGRQLLFAVISDNVNIEEDEPEVMYTSSIHGDETTGYILMLRLIDSLLVSYGSDSLITRLVDSCEIWINPLANPDGTYNSGDHTVYGATRYNAADVDLNRNFPDPEAGDNPDGHIWQPETEAMMDLAEAHNFVISANLHGGAEVLNYPWDTWYRRHADDAWFIDIARDYADSAQYNSPGGYFTDLNNGITNGYDWYRITGGRQDYMNYWHHCREVTLELSHTKLLDSSSLPAYWNYNKAAFLNYLENALYGVRGIITDAGTGDPIMAKMRVLGHDIDSSEVLSDPDIGDFHRMLEAGTYDFEFSAPGYYDEILASVTVTDFSCIVINAALTALPILPDLAFDSYTADFADPGDTIDITITLVNEGMGNATGLIGTLSTTDSYVTITQAVSTYPTIPAEGGSGTSLNNYQYVVASDCPAYHTIDFALELSGDMGYSDNLNFSIIVGQQVETYETGDFSLFEWEMSGDQPWTVDAAEPYQGAYCAKSGAITHGENTEMSVTLEITDPGTISFYYKVSSEPGWDYFRFYVDGTLKNQWSGGIDWTLAAFEVAAGTHTFRWKYSKDGSMSSGDDCAWVDAIAFPPVSTGIPVQIVTPSVPDWTEGRTYSVQLEAIGGQGTLSWSDKNGDLAGTGLMLSGSGLLSGIPSASGTISFTAQVSDTAGSTDERPYSLTINPPVTITAATLPPTTEGVAYSRQLQAAGGTGVLTWSDKFGDLVGTGLTLSGSGLLSGTPISSGTVSFTASVSDQPGSTDDQAFELTINPAVAILTMSLPGGTRGEPYSYQLEASGGTGVRTWSDKYDDLPGTGLAFSTDGLLSGIPLSGGEFSFTAQVTDEPGSSAEKLFAFSINAAFTCGDVNRDEDINLLDILYLIDYIYGNPIGPAPDPPESGDVNNGDGETNLLDILYLVSYIYGNPQGPEPVCP
ncbi:MAG: hypothetical protein JSV44_05985 [Candidatus Zixiibacteriota bacterium]|nr:MAG: hypothetical protein JSV44_05985 [candidate division Zixibacteria bacterium]